jgi:hypothetical protein
METTDSSLRTSGSEKKEGLRSAASGFVKDAFDVGGTVLVMIIVLRLLFGSQTIVPLVVVTSGSMLHLDDDWHTWLSVNLGNETLVDSFPFKSGFARGDMIFTVSPTRYHLFPDTRLGDVVIYERDLAPQHRYRTNEPIIHRVVGVVWIVNDSVSETEGSLGCLKAEDFTKYVDFVKSCREKKPCVYPRYPEENSYRFYITKGDNNPSPDQCGVNGGIAYPVNEKQLKARGWVRLPYVGWIKLIFNFILELIFWLIRLLLSLIPL